MLQHLLLNDDGMETVEVVIIAAVLVGLALLFRRQIFGLLQNLLGQIDASVIEDNLTVPPQ